MPTARANATMSSAGAAVLADVVPAGGGGAHNSRGDRKAGKGRRRRAAAEQRRIEQQRWGKYLDEEDEDFPVVAPIPPGSRRRARRRNDRENLNSLAYDEELDPDLSLALALSLSSIAEENPAPQIVPAIADMTYESLVQLENVPCVASAAVVAALPVCFFVKEQVAVSEVCVICQGEYDHDDSQVQLPCLHAFHQACGAQWLLKYSKLCPVCKHDVTEVAASEVAPSEAAV